MNFVSLKAISIPDTYLEKSFSHSLYPVSKPREEGYLKVSEIHAIHYATYGNPEGIPVVVLHGGPGFGCFDGMTETFDLDKWSVIMFDQRGSGKSKPQFCLEENTTPHLVEDIEALRKHLKIDQWILFGGSWGSTLALLYGQAHPDQCLGFILRGTFLAREHDALSLYYGAGKIFPEAYEEVLNYIPKEEHEDLLTAFCSRAFDPDPKVQLEASRVFSKFNATCVTHSPNPESVEKSVEDEALIVGVMKICSYYVQNKFFLEPNQILKNMSKISHLPGIIIQGRWDAICPPSMAYSLHKSWPKSALWMVSDGGHSGKEKSVAKALCTATDFFAESFFKVKMNMENDKV